MSRLSRTLDKTYTPLTSSECLIKRNAYLWRARRALNLKDKKDATYAVMLAWRWHYSAMEKRKAVKEILEII